MFGWCLGISGQCLVYNSDSSIDIINGYYHSFRMSLNRRSQFCFSLCSISGSDGKVITTEMLKEVLCLEKEVRGEILPSWSSVIGQKGHSNAGLWWGQLGQRGKRREAGGGEGSSNAGDLGGRTACEALGREAGSAWRRPCTPVLPSPSPPRPPAPEHSQQRGQGELC